MRRVTLTAPLAFIAGILLLASLLVLPESRRMSETSAIAAPPLPTATYVSELGPASVRPPRYTVALPASGAGINRAGIAWPKFAGLALALGGALLVHASLTLRSSRTAQS